MSYYSTVRGTGVVGVQTRSVIFTMCGMSLWVGHRALYRCRASHN